MTRLAAWAVSTSLFALISRFSLVGILATGTYFVVANTLLLFSHLDNAIASVLGYIAGMVVSFIGQRSFTFRASRNITSQISRFTLLSFAGLAVSYYSVHVVETEYGASPIWGTVVTALFIPVLSFVVMKAWVFAADPHGGR